MTDRERLIVLLGALHDLDPGLETSTGNLVRRGALRGEAPTVWRPCDPCLGEGVRLDRFKRPSRCETCKGLGRERVDPYTGRRVETREMPLSLAELIRKDTKTVRCSFCDGTCVYKQRPCGFCDATGRVPVPGSWLSDERRTAEPVGDKLLDAIDARDEAGDFHQLELALGALRLRAPRVWRLVHATYVRRDHEPANGDGPVLEVGLAWLRRQLPDRLRVPGYAVKADRRRADQLRRVKGRGVDARALARRDKEIRSQHGRGVPVQVVGREFGLSVRAVYDVMYGREVSPV